jgi:3-oxoacyl-[acyl-carrier protein] reductase
VEIRLDGKVALVTGGSRGIGRAVARRLAEAGADVMLSSRREADLAEAAAALGGLDGRAAWFAANVGEPGAAEACVSATLERFGGIDILVNNAGILVLGTVDRFSLDDFDRMVAVNVRAVFVAVQEAARHMKPGGRVINIGSMVADRTGFPGASVYGMTKAAVAGLTRGLAIDLAPRGITVNNVQPGPTETDMNPRGGLHHDLVVNLLPVKRAGTADEIAGLVAYLASAEAAFVTGASLTIDGGLTA